MKCNAIIFDMDGLLINSEPLWRIAERDVFARLGLNLTDKDVAESTGIRLQEVVKMRYAQKPWEDVTLKEAEELIVDRVVEGIFEGIPLLPGVESLIAQVAASGLPAAIASSSPVRIIEAAVKQFNWERTFPFTQSAELLEKGKPDPEVYLLAAKGLNADPARCLAFEDSIPGVEAAMNAGMVTIAVPDEEFTHNPLFDKAHARYSSLEDFKLKDWI